MKRGRGRGGRKPSNSLNRTMESNGPDVKVRGTAHQICEKYLALARDAHASGDRIGNESYLQHAEHYHRIILATQPTPAPDAPQVSPNNQADQGSDEAAASETSTSEETSGALAESETNGAEAPRATRARRGRRTRSERSDRGERSNGRSNGSEADAVEATEAKDESVPAVEASSNDGDAPAETA